MLVDTHCHIHEANFPLDVGDTIKRAYDNDVTKLLCVGTSLQSSKEAIEFALQHNQYASVGVHPHDTKEGWSGIVQLVKDVAPTRVTTGFTPGSIRATASDRTRVADGSDTEQSQPPRSRLIAVGEIGLDYFYTHSPRETQLAALEAQLQIASDNNVPVIFHVREAFDDFWPVFNNFPGLQGVLHSFTDSSNNLEKALSNDLYIGVNGISTFTKDSAQQMMYDAIPLDKLLLETDAPFLTPMPHRGKVNEPAFVRVIAEYHATRRSISLAEIASVTTANATALFAL